MYLIAKMYGVDWEELGLTSKNLIQALKDSWRWTTFWGVVILTFATFRADVFSFPELQGDPYDSAGLRILLYVLISVPLQELIFRGFLIKRISLVSRNSMFVIIYTSIVFALAHLFFANYRLAIATFFVSLWWTSLFLKHRNMWPVIASHGLLGGMVFAVTFGLI